MKTIGMLVVVGIAMLGFGCASTGGSTGGTTGKVWTYNLQQALARSGGDVAMTMALDQGVSKQDAVGLCNALIVFIEGGDVTLAALNAKINDLSANKPQFASFVGKLNSAIPLGIGKTERIPPEVKSVLLSFLRDGAVYGATMYKDGLQLKKVVANEGLQVNP